MVDEVRAVLLLGIVESFPLSASTLASLMVLASSADVGVLAFSASAAFAAASSASRKNSAMIRKQSTRGERKLIRDSRRFVVFLVSFSKESSQSPLFTD